MNIFNRVSFYFCNENLNIAYLLNPYMRYYLISLFNEKK